MRIDFLMKPNINTFQGYTKTVKGDTIFITHDSTNKIICIVHEDLNIYRLKKDSTVKRITYFKIEKYFIEKGYRKI